MARFDKTYCSQCGGEFGPGDEGYSHCVDHPTRPATVDDYMHLADVMAQRLSEFLHPDDWDDYGEARKAYDTARKRLHAALVAGLVGAEDCPACKGAGEREVFRGDLGPDSYSELMPCPDCKGTGNAAVSESS